MWYAADTYCWPKLHKKYIHCRKYIFLRVYIGKMEVYYAIEHIKLGSNHRCIFK